MGYCRLRESCYRKYDTNPKQVSLKHRSVVIARCDGLDQGFLDSLNASDVS